MSHYSAGTQHKLVYITKVDTEEWKMHPCSKRKLARLFATGRFKWAQGCVHSKTKKKVRGWLPVNRSAHSCPLFFRLFSLPIFATIYRTTTVYYNYPPSSDHHLARCENAHVFSHAQRTAFFFPPCSAARVRTGEKTLPSCAFLVSTPIRLNPARNTRGGCEVDAAGQHAPFSQM